MSKAIIQSGRIIMSGSAKQIQYTIQHLIITYGSQTSVDALAQLFHDHMNVER